MSNVVLLSLFDGIRGASVALQRLGIELEGDYSCEIDARCQRFISSRWPRTVQLGDVQRLLEERVLEGIVGSHPQAMFLVVGGPPCQDLSSLRGACRQGLSGPKSSLFFVFAEVLRKLQRLVGQESVFFLMENVQSMADTDRDTISSFLEVQPLDIDAAFVTGCSRKRYYWTNIVQTHGDLQKLTGISAKMFVDDDWDCSPPNDRFACLCTSKLGPHSNKLTHESTGETRYLNARERERLMGFQEGYTDLPFLSDRARRHMLGNSFVVSVVQHILQSLVCRREASS